MESISRNEIKIALRGRLHQAASKIARVAMIGTSDMGIDEEPVDIEGAVYVPSNAPGVELDALPDESFWEEFELASREVSRHENGDRVDRFASVAEPVKEWLQDHGLRRPSSRPARRAGS